MRIGITAPFFLWFVPVFSRLRVCQFLLSCLVSSYFFVCLLSMVFLSSTPFQYLQAFTVAELVRFIVSCQCALPHKRRVCAVLFPLKFPSLCSWFVIFSDVYVMFPSPHKSRVCAVLFHRLPSRLHAWLLIFNIQLCFCYAGQYRAITSRISSVPVQFARFCFSLYHSAAWLLSWQSASLLCGRSRVRSPDGTNTQGLK